jgi:class 3 adenylate cyclase
MSASTLAPRLDALRVTRAFPEETLARFARHLEAEPEEELFRMSPYRYASRTGLAPRTAIDLFLHATHAGILDFTWGVLCPNCAAFLSTASALRALAHGQECRLCQIPISPEVDDNVEVAFTVARTVRSIRFQDPLLLDPDRDVLDLYFSSSVSRNAAIRPVLTQARLGAWRLAPGETLEIRRELRPGRCELMSVTSHSTARLTVSEAGPHEVDVDVLDGPMVPADISLGAGPARIRARNRGSGGTVLMLSFMGGPGFTMPEDLGKGKLERFLTGKELITSQVFRELFHAESIPAEGGLALKGLTVLFTDLKGSTDLYSRVGDLNAYALVREHFSVLRDAVARCGGAVVKTIGDAVMASFPEPAPALEAAVAMTREIAKVPGDLQLKIGLHAGPVIAVELNERLDYFGQTVNIAARVQGIAAAREIVLTGAIREAPGAREIIRGSGFGEAAEQARLKGVKNEVPVWRLA